MKTNYIKKKLFPLILSFISIIGYSQTSTTQKFHDTKGNIDVTKAGQLQYTLPIDVPPGVKKVAPDISLIYTSGGQNGIAGYGWNIAGLTAISRVGKTLEVDGLTKGIQLDYTDYYSFNGQRLILKSGEYGKNGAEYVTEKYSNIKIKSIGELNQIYVGYKGPEIFEVTFEDGSVATYGRISYGATQSALNATTPIDYNITRWRDPQGNYITYSYNMQGNVSIISTIEWGGNEIQNKPHFNKIEFSYTVRPKAETAYVRGYELSQNKLLQSITVSTNNNQYKKYNVTYKQDAQKTSNRYLDKITVLNSNNEEANPVVFTYEQSGSVNNDTDLLLAKSTSLKPNSDTDVVGDFDGDGNLDLLRYHSSTSARIPQTGVYLYKNFYAITYNTENPIFINSTLQELKNFIPVNFKKANLIHNKHGLAGLKKVINPSTSKLDIEVSFYSFTDNNELVLDFKRTIPNAHYDNTYGTSQDGVQTTVIGLKNVDFNGDGLSELVLDTNDKECYPISMNEAKLPHKCENHKRYYVIDPDQSLQNINQWFYSLSLYTALEEDAFQDYRAGDFNGDGVFDFLKLDANKKPLLITFQKNLQNKYFSTIAPFHPANIETIKGYWGYSLAGDLNGDGVSDLMLPETNTSDYWYIYTSRGVGFKEEKIKFVAPRPSRTVEQDLNNHIDIANPRTFGFYDINNDGKSELIALSSYRFYFKEYFQDSNQGVKYERRGSYSAHILSYTGGYYTVSEPNFPSFSDLYDRATIYLNNTNISGELAPNTNDLVGLSVDQWTGAMLRNIVMVSITTIGHDFGNAQVLISQKYFDISKGARIKSILQGGVTTNITYKQLDKTLNPGLYDVVKTESYPYVEINQSAGMFVVSGITQSTMSNNVLRQDFRYRGLISNILGRGMIGFRKTARSTWYTDGFENTKIWSGVEIDPLNEGIPIKEWSIRTNTEANIFPADISENNPQLLSFRATTYQIDKILNGQVVTSIQDTDKPKIVTAILPKTNKGKDFLTNKVAENTTTYGQFYLPSQTISKINSTFAVTTTNYEYSHNPSGAGANYYIGRPITKTETVQAYNDTKSGKDEYLYENNLIKAKSSWNRDNTQYLQETYTYDGFGNIVQKVIGNSVDSQTETTVANYDVTGRFIVSKTDNLGLVTNYTYNDFGQILSQTDPLQNVITNTYDGWGKLLTSKSNLAGITTYLYERDNNSNVILTQDNADGGQTKKYVNKLGQEFKTTTKAFGQGLFVSKNIEYDLLGRKISESEPYYEGQSPGQYNAIAYDDSVYPAKVTTTDFTGKQIETLVSGLTTTATELNGYNRTTSKTKDALGNVIVSTDKGGTIHFSFNAAGEQIKAQYEDNIVTTQYDSWGRKSEFEDPSNGIYSYEYNGLAQVTKIKSPKGDKNFIYNAQGQVIRQTEISDDGSSTIKDFTIEYDNFGRVTKKTGMSNGNLYTVSIEFDSHGRIVKNIENSNGKTYSQNGIAYDNLSRIKSYSKSIESSGGSSIVHIENFYHDWNGELYLIEDAISKNALWQIEETNAKGQILQSILGAATIKNAFDSNGFLANTNHSSGIHPSILQIAYSFDAIKNELQNRTTGGDFSISETFTYEDNNRLSTWTDPRSGQNSSNIYDDKGRIRLNDQLGEINYDNGTKIYQQTSINLNANGIQNYYNDLVQHVLYNENNDPVYIDGEKGDVAFQYGLTSMRQRITYGGDFGLKGDGLYTKLYNENGSFEITKNNSDGLEKHIIYIEGTPYESNIVFVKNYEQKIGSFKFLHKDYLGSILAISDKEGNKLEQRHFDAWGNFTHLQFGSGTIVTNRDDIKELIAEHGGLFVDRGYTGHEHFLEVGIIHMNGRLYDPLLRRFLNADENIQDPTNTQNYNKYGYVMNNPLMYNDPNGEFWWWAAGAIVGGYLNGVSANNGQWNPGKWNWESTWSAVLGGAIGGAAISGTLGNITNNAGAIKSFLPGIVSGGLSSAFNGSNFLSGAIGGISYTSNIFDNSITSTDGISTAYKYIVSPEQDNDGDWEGLTKSILLSYVKTNFCPECSDGALQQKAGTKFEEAFHTIMRPKFKSMHYTSNKDKFQGMYKGRPRNTIPDAVYDLVDIEGGLFDGYNFKRYYGASFAEVKAMDGTLYSSSNQGQIYSMINYLGNSYEVKRVGSGNFIIGTTFGTYISPNIYKYAGEMKINITHYRAYYRMILGKMHVSFNSLFDSTDSTILK